MAHSNFELFKQQEAFNQASFQGHFGRTGRYAKEVSDPSLKLWLDFLAKKDIAADSICQLPKPYVDCWQAWLAYNRGQLEQANVLFASCHAGLDQLQDAALAIDAGLGLGRLYTRSGYFATARDWLLYAANLSRLHDRLYDTVRSFGALGDLFVRAGHNQQALFCLNTAHQLLPPGAGERSRQMNYLATALMRLNTSRDQTAAEELLMQSYYLAQDTGDMTSILHSMARLQFLYLDRQQPDVDVCQLLQFQPDRQAEHSMQHIPLGFLAMGRALAAMQLAHHELAAALAKQACEYLKNHPAEYYWALSLHSLLLNDKTQLPGLKLSKLHLHAAPLRSSVINQQWHDLSLQDMGAQLFQPQLQADSLIQHRQVFFI